MGIQLHNWKIQSLKFDMTEKVTKEDSFSLKVGQAFPEDQSQQFFVIFDIDLKNKSFDLVFQVAFAFTTEEEITEEFKSSDFPKKLMLQQ